MMTPDPKSTLYNRVKVQVHIKPTHGPHVRDFKVQTVDKDLIRDNPCLMILPFVWNWPTVVCAQSFITDNDQITLCDVPQSFREGILEMKGHTILNVIYHLDTGDWLIHASDEKGDSLEYEWTNPDPRDTTQMWVRENPEVPQVIDV